MKHLIKLSFITLALLLASNANAQSLPVSMGIKGGINVSNSSSKQTKSIVGYNAGLTLDVNLPSNVAIMTGLEITSKGAKMKDADLKVDATYLQLPIHLGYKMNVAPGVTAHFDIGPYFAQGVWGKTKGSQDLIHPTTGEVLKTLDINQDTFGDDVLKRFDWGLGIGVGVTFMGKIQILAGYDHGIASTKIMDEKFRNRNVFASVGWKFF